MEGFEVEIPTYNPIRIHGLLKNTNWKWLALLLIQLATFGNQYCFDGPQALQRALQDELQLSLTQYNGLYSAYSLTNFIMPIIWGLAIDKFGNRTILLILTVLISIGQAMVSIGGYTHNYDMLLLGRLIYGLGCESQYFSVQIGVNDWFHSGHLALAQSTQNLVYGLTSSMNSHFTPLIYEKTKSIGEAFTFGFWTTIFSLITTLLFILMDHQDAKVEKHIQNVSQTPVTKPEFRPWQSIKACPKAFWAVFVIHYLISGRFYTFTNMANDLYAFRYKITAREAGIMLILFYTLIGFLSPIFGCLVDAMKKKGRLFVIIGFLCLGSAMIDNYQFYHRNTSIKAGLCPLTMLAVMYAFWNAILWPFVAEILPKSVIGFSYGLLVISQNLSMVLSLLLGGMIGDSFDTKWSSYFAVLTYISTLAFLACACCIIMPRLEKKTPKNVG